MRHPLVLLLIVLSLRVNRCEIVVNTRSGQVRGIFVPPSLFYAPYYAFKGIPYAEPPIGELRFRNPVPHRGWSDIRDATEHGHACPTNGIVGLTAGGEEDCLFINVYTTDVLASRPVMFWIHGGGYLIGSGDSFMYGPSRLVRENIVVVTFNYRLGALGFLSTGDKHAQGNYGLKDILLALRWVHENIGSFGGDPSRVTIAGESSGAVSVHHLMLARQTEGLFHQAILMSGCVFSPFAFQHNPRSQAEKLAKALGISFNSTVELVEKLRMVHVQDILRFQRDMLAQAPPVGLHSFDFSLVVEPEDSPEERLVIDTPENLMRRGHFRAVPVLIGTLNAEGILNLFKFYKPGLFELYNRRPEFLVPSYLNVTQSDEIEKAASIVRQAYFNDENISRETAENYAQFMTDVVFKFPVDRAVKLMLREANFPLFYYDLSYDGSLNFLKIVVGLKKYSGALHGDDLFYLFHPESVPMSMARSLVPATDHAFVVRDRIVKLWCNFVKFGNPTPYVDDLIGIQWPQHTLEHEEYFEIGEELNVRHHFDRLRLWYKLLEEYA